MNGRPVPAGNLLTEGSFGVRVDGEALVCDRPCGFGSVEGRYTFVVEAEGADPLPISVDARFATFEGGCPSSNADGTRISIAFTR